MPAVLDYPDGSKPIDPSRFNVRGWLWLDEQQDRIVAVEATCGGVVLGSSKRLLLRPDVCRALDLPSDRKTGFEFFADNLDATALGFQLDIRVLFSDGSWSESLVSRQLSVIPTARRESLSPSISRSMEHRAHPHSLTPPPDYLQVRQVGGVWGALFFTEGAVLTMQVASLFESVGLPLSEVKKLLDFGCGCGRVLYGLRQYAPSAEIWGCDIDNDAIEWDRLNLGHIARFCASPTLPPLPFSDEYFDAVYAISVFTHLPEPLQYAWILELRRVTRPGAIIVISLHGRHYWENVDSDVHDEVLKQGFAYRVGVPTEGLPDHYMVAFHAMEYVRDRWGWFFDVLGVREKFIHSLHDAVILRRRMS